MLKTVRFLFKAGVFTCLLAYAVFASGGYVGWSRAVTEYDFVGISCGYVYLVPVGPWKLSPVAPVDQFNPGHGLAAGVALQGRWFRFAADMAYARPDTGEWERYARGVGFAVDSTAKFWLLGFSVGLNPWYRARVSPYWGLVLGGTKPLGKDVSAFHRAGYHFLADGKYSFFVGAEFAAPLRLANQVFLLPSVRYLSASETDFLGRENHRVNNLVWSVKFEWRVPMSLF